MLRATALIVTVGIMVLGAIGSASALDVEGEKAFSHYMDMRLADLTDATAEQLAAKYPNEDWASWGFPDYVVADKTVEISYRVAVKEPELLGRANVSDKQFVIPCYCTCQRFGHANLLYCFWKDGRAGGEFDEHGSQCAVCMRQAFLAFLWSELGASHQEIMTGMEKKFAPLIKMQQEGKI
jgi:hypothetical protein